MPLKIVLLLRGHLIISLYCKAREGEREGELREGMGSNRVKRGSSWNKNTRNCRSAYRNCNPSRLSININFPV